MVETQNLVLQWIVIILGALLLIGSFSWFAPATLDCPTCPTCPEVELEAPEVNLTSIEGSIAEIQSTLDEDEDWENEAEALAIAEWEKRDYKEIYKTLSDEIDDRDDISSVTIKDTRFAGMDVEDEDAIVEHFLKVRYEDTDGDDVKTYFYIETSIEEGEADIIEIYETDKDCDLDGECIIILEDNTDS